MVRGHTDLIVAAEGVESRCTQAKACPKGHVGRRGRGLGLDVCRRYQPWFPGPTQLLKRRPKKWGNKSSAHLRTAKLDRGPLRPHLAACTSGQEGQGQGSSPAYGTATPGF